MTWSFYTSAGVMKVASDEAGSVGDADTLDGFNSTAFVFKSGDTMTGALTLSGAPSTNLHAATKLYVDTTSASAAAAAVTGVVSKSGDTMTGDLIMSGGSTKITLPNTPLSATDAANKNYVDTAALPVTGGSVSGNINLTGSASLSLANASTISWSDVSLSRIGIGGAIEVSLGDQIRVQQDPIHANDVARKAYVDTLVGGASTLDGLTDVDLTGFTIGDVLTYDGSFWVALPPQPPADTIEVVSTSPYAATADFTTLACDTSASALTINLPDSSSIPTGTRYTIKDASGNANVNNITVQSAFSEAIDGNLTYTLDNPYEFVTLVYDGSMWFVVG